MNEQKEYDENEEVDWVFTLTSPAICKGGNYTRRWLSVWAECEHGKSGDCDCDYCGLNKGDKKVKAEIAHATYKAEDVMERKPPQQIELFAEKKNFCHMTAVCECVGSRDNPKDCIGYERNPAQGSMTHDCAYYLYGRCMNRELREGNNAATD